MKKAFTLLELMIAVSIFAGLIIMSIGALSRTTVSDTTKTTKEVNKAGKTFTEALKDTFNNLPNQNTLNYFTNPGYEGYAMWDDKPYRYNVYSDGDIPTNGSMYGRCRVNISASGLVQPPYYNPFDSSASMGDPCSTKYFGGLRIIEDTSDPSLVNLIVYEQVPVTGKQYSANLLYKKYSNCAVEVKQMLESISPGVILPVTVKNISCHERVADQFGYIDRTKLSDFYEGKYVLDVNNSGEYIWKRSDDGTQVILDFYIKPNEDKYNNVYCKNWINNNQPIPDEYSGCRNVKVTYNVGPW